jgi:diguanylate cyclase (GGDEF)-like protein/PAS domain S-box-containing protein
MYNLKCHPKVARENGQIVKFPVRKSPAKLIAEDAANIDNVLDAMFEGVYFVDRERRIQKWNSGAASLTGFTSEELLHSFCADNILLHVDERGVELCKADCPLQKTLEDAKSRQATLYLRHKLGYRVPVLVRTSAIRDASGEVVGAVEAFRELGEPEHWKARISELEQVAFVDPVTGIGNRHFIETQLNRLLHEFQSVAEPFTICMLDVDHFKSANDEFGHQFGDRVLRTLAQTLLNSLRSTDLLGRWGGDEFVLLLPKAGLERAKQVVERSRVLIAETGTPTSTGFLKVTVSIGGVVATAEDDRTTLIHRVDQQLYSAKAQGRNCCSIV